MEALLSDHRLRGARCNSPHRPVYDGDQLHHSIHQECPGAGKKGPGLLRGVGYRIKAFNEFVDVLLEKRHVGPVI